MFIKQIGLWVGLVLTALSPASARVTVEITQDQGQYLPCSGFITAVRITKRSGEALRLGG